MAYAEYSYTLRQTPWKTFAVVYAPVSGRAPGKLRILYESASRARAEAILNRFVDGWL